MGVWVWSYGRRRPRVQPTLTLHPSGDPIRTTLARGPDPCGRAHDGGGSISLDGACSPPAFSWILLTERASKSLYNPKDVSEVNKMQSSEFIGGDGDEFAKLSDLTGWKQKLSLIMHLEIMHLEETYGDVPSSRVSTLLETLSWI